MKNADAAAMPTQSNGGDIFGGITKREMMAMHMMSGMLSSHTKGTPSKFAEASVKLADALLAELECTCHKT